MGIVPPTLPNSTVMYHYDSKTQQRLNLLELWHYRYMIYMLILRDFTSFYKQSLGGVLWVFLAPITTMLTYSLIFGQIINLDTQGIPYPLFSFLGLIIWNYFSGVLKQASQSLLKNRPLLTKVYIPQLAMPMIAAIQPLIDLALSSMVLVVLLIIYPIAPTWRLLLLPLWLVYAALVALSIGLWLAVIAVRYRDTNFILQGSVQLLLYSTPLIYSLTSIPKAWLPLYALNPLVTLVHGFRWSFVGGDFLPIGSVLGGLVGVLVLFVGGLLFFDRFKSEFADVV
jgi:lipopolysaccharide transport system permease protein